MVLSLPERLRRPGPRVAVVDALAAFASWPLVQLLADPGRVAGRPAMSVVGEAIAFACLGAALFAWMRLARMAWRYAGVRDMARVAGAGACAAIAFGLVLGALGHPSGFTPFLPVLHALVLGLLMLLPRTLFRLSIRQAEAADGARDVLVAGAGDGADLFLHALSQDAAPRYRVLGLLADQASQRGRQIEGVPVLGMIEEFAHALTKLGRRGLRPSMLVVSAPDLSGQRLTTLLDAAAEAGLAVATLPTLTNLETGGRIDPRPIAIEDLLDRPQARPDRDAMARLVSGRRVLVTGAGGTIGSELARQVAALGPAELVLLDNGEYALYAIDLELSEAASGVPRVAVLADVRDRERILGIFAQHRPELVFHAAALKHVPMVEANPLEGIMSNAVGSRHVADAARAHGAASFVLISTDKAVNPTSTMGATKRLAEMYCQALDIRARAEGAATGFVTVRFGNVLGSTGSVVPLFRRQLERGGPLTVTHPDMQRYFMTVREAVGLVLTATVTRPAGSGAIIVLDMGEPVRIVELARRMIRLVGLRPDIDVKIAFTGLRPGEKLHEELFHGREVPVDAGVPGLLVAEPRAVDLAIVTRAMDEIAVAARAGRTGPALSVLAAMVPEFERRDGGLAADRAGP